MAGKSIKIIAHVWNLRHVQPLPLQFIRLTNHTLFKTNDDLRQIIENHLKLFLAMKGIWLASQVNGDAMA